MKFRDLLIREESSLKEALVLNQSHVLDLLPKRTGVSEEEWESDFSDLVDVINTFYARKNYPITIKKRM